MNGFAAITDAAYKIDIVACLMLWKIFTKLTLSGDCLTLHARISESAPCETTNQRLEPGAIFRLCVGARRGDPNCGEDY